MEVLSFNPCHQYSVQTPCRAMDAFGILKSVIVSALVAVLGLASSACSPRYDDMPAYLPFDLTTDDNRSVGRFKTSYLAQQIDQYYRGTNPGPLGVTTFVNVDDLYSTSTFGRVVAEQLMTELAMQGFDVIELRHSDALQFLNNEGEFALSREMGAVRRERKLGGVVVGTYVVSPERVYLNARLIDPTSSMILSAASVEMSKTAEIAKLARAGGLPGTLERIPVKHLGLSTFPMELTPGYVQQRWAAEEGGTDSPPNPSFGAKHAK